MKRPVAVITMCHQCKESGYQFPSENAKFGGLCDRCYRKNKRKTRDYRSMDHPRMRARLWHAYKIELEYFIQIFKSQNGKCPICSMDLGDLYSNSNIHVDHDHNTSLVRGLLCQTCNMGLGFFRDTPDRLRSAANYLDRYTISP